MRPQTSPKKRRPRTAIPKTAGRPGSVAAFLLLLAAGTLVLYAPVRSFEFLNYDDDQYVLNNEHINSGINGPMIRWALTSTEQANWHPVTWLSHALDCQWFGLDAGYHHLVSVAIHTFNVLLLFLLLWTASGAAGRSFIAAALFAWHPFNVESVAWVAERKTLLSALFSLLTIGAYGWYARQPRWDRYLLVAAVFLLALASKPMAVTLPLALLLLDYWPLERIAGWTEPSSRFPAPQQSPWRLLCEKLPLLALAAAVSAITVRAQKAGGTLESLELYPLATRVTNALWSYAVYIGKALWPSSFAVLYPYPAVSLPWLKPAAAAALLCAMSTVVWKQRRARGWLAVGWFWFLGGLIPVIGIVQAGDQAMADRYAYFPLIGLAVMVVWGAANWFDSRRWSVRTRWLTAFAVLASLSWVTVRQIGYWKNSVTLWSHCLEVTGENLHSEKELANAWIRQGDNAEALPHLLKLAKLAPDDVWIHANMGACYAAEHLIPRAIEEFETVVRLTDHETLSPVDRGFRSSALLNAGLAYIFLRDYSKAMTSFQAANRSDPAFVDQAIVSFHQSLNARPNQGDYLRLSLLLRAKGDTDEASTILEEAVRTHPDYTVIRDFLNPREASSK